MTRSLQGVWLAILIYSAQLTKNCSVIHTYRTREKYVHSTVTFTVCKQCDRVATQIIAVILSTCVHNSPAINCCCSFLKSTCKLSGRVQETDSTEDTITLLLLSSLRMTDYIWVIDGRTQTKCRVRGCGDRQRGDFSSNPQNFEEEPWASCTAKMPEPNCRRHKEMHCHQTSLHGRRVIQKWWISNWNTVWTGPFPGLVPYVPLAGGKITVCR